jgi:hypothetical protein
MNRLKLQRLKKAMKCIEFISCEEGFNRTKIHHNNEIPTKVESDEVLDLIYEFAHVGNGRCRANHNDWIERLDRFYDKFCRDAREPLSDPLNRP